MMDMQKQGRYCRYHEAPSGARGGAGLGAWLKSLAGSLPQGAGKGRKRILPGQDNRNLGAGWHEAKSAHEVSTCEARTFIEWNDSRDRTENMYLPSQVPVEEMSLK